MNLSLARKVPTRTGCATNHSSGGMKGAGCSTKAGAASTAAERGAQQASRVEQPGAFEFHVAVSDTTVAISGDDTQ